MTMDSFYKDLFKYLAGREIGSKTSDDEGVWIKNDGIGLMYRSDDVICCLPFHGDKIQLSLYPEENSPPLLVEIPKSLVQDSADQILEAWNRSLEQETLERLRPMIIKYGQRNPLPKSAASPVSFSGRSHKLRDAREVESGLQEALL